MREIRMLRSMWRGLETTLRSGLHGHERRNPGYRQGQDLRTVAPALDPTDLGHLRRSAHVGRKDLARKLLAISTIVYSRRLDLDGA